MSETQVTHDQVLEFRLGEETYCVSIDTVTEIVDTGEVTSVPNSPPHVTGVMDLRGQTTSIVDPKVVFGIDGDGAEQRIIVFDSDIIEDQGAAGWLVDEVNQVVRVDDDEVDESPSEDEQAVNGVVKRDDGFVIWVDPEAVHAG